MSACVLCAFVSCTPQQQQQSQNQAQQAAGVARATVNRAYLVGVVEARLIGVDADAATSVHVSLLDGIATLSGQARSADERNRYVNAVKSVRGVAGVRDELSVNPNLQGIGQRSSDAALAVRVGAAIAAEAGVNLVHVQPSASRGVVTLRGTVPSRSIHETIVETTQHVPGVKAVIDQLVVQ
jgi:hyperosmotically inducible periplasmic protein